MIIRAIKRSLEFYPEFNDNKKLPLANQLKIEFTRIPGTSEKGKYEEYGFSQNGQMTIHYNNKEMILAFVGKLTNAIFTYEDGEQFIAHDAVDLASVVSPEAEELFSQMRNYLFPPKPKLSEGESKA